jgi:type IV secretory pathway TrbL component
MKTNRHLSLVVQSVYVVLTGLQLIFVPNLLLGMFGFNETSEIWIKVLGIVILPLAFVYYAINKQGNPDVVRATVWSRLFVGIGFTLLAFSGQAPMNLILFAGIDIATAVWTWMELRKAA